MHFVEELVAVRPYRLTLRFNTGKVRAVDLESFLRTKAGTPQSTCENLLDPATFCRARLDPQSRTVCWDGLAREITGEGTDQPAPLDLCSDVLYGLSTTLAQDPAARDTDEKRTQAEPSSLVLKDEPPRAVRPGPSAGANCKSSRYAKSGRGQPHSKTLRVIWHVDSAARSWSAAVLCRFCVRPKGNGDSETPH
jgi:hypothetical protein